MADPLTNYSRTQRIVLLIDLTPLLQSPDNNPSYLTTLLATVKTVLSFPCSSSSLFSLKPFFSSLSPLLSSSKLPSPPPLSLSFDLPSSTLLSLSSLLSTFSSSPSSSCSSSSARAPHLAASLRQLLHQYAWDSVVSDDPPFSASGTSLNSDDCTVKPNLVLLFSPGLRSLKSLAEFFGVGVDDECLRDVDAFVPQFRGVFGGVNEAFVSRGIHFSWVDVRREVGCGLRSESELGFTYFNSAVRDLRWGFCSSDSIVLGSAVVPFSLIYPRIGVSRRLLELDDRCKRIRAQLSLEIGDVSGKPLECKCCDIELVDLSKMLGFNTKLMDSQVAGCEPQKTVWEDFCDGFTKLHVKAKAVQMHDKCATSVGAILLQEYSRDSDDVMKEDCSEFSEDRVLEILRAEMREPLKRKCVPIWQILLSFLCRKGYSALVCISNGNGKSLTGMLKPFTVSSALVSITEGEIQPQGVASEYDEAVLGKNCASKVCKLETNVGNLCGLVSSQCGPDSCAKLGVDKRKKDNRSLHMLQELTWSSFCKAAIEHTKIEVEEIYLARDPNKSKKLKFLKCWMKQIAKSSHCRLTTLDRSKPLLDIPKEVDSRLTRPLQESEQQLASCASGGEDSLTAASRIQDDDALALPSETPETFFSDLSKKVQQGLECEEIELGSLADRLVNSSIYWLYQKREKDNLSESQTPVGKYDDCSAAVVAAELTKLLLREPNDLASLYRDSSSSVHASDSILPNISSENIIRLYELQILFRMEILQSEVGASIGESTKQKFQKHICLLLETIQCQLTGDFFGDWSLEKYVGKIIKSRYCHSLGDMVHKIYEELDLLLLSEEDELPNLLLNSEDSIQYLREEPARNEMVDNYRASDTVSVEDESLKEVEDECVSFKGMNKEEHARKLIVAQERRQRARRFAHFTSWVPDLQRVWAPKQPKAVRSNWSQPGRSFKRKEPKTNYDTVCNTPTSGNKRSCEEGRNSDEQKHQHFGNFCGSVSKALFQDD